MASIENKVEDLLEKPINDLGYSLYDVEYIKEGKDYYLRIFIDKEDGIDLNDCEKVNNLISDLLDKEDYIKVQYYLEVSSPGVERVLRKDKHLKENIGIEVRVNLFQSVDNIGKSITGILEDFDEQKIVLNYTNKEIALQRSNISLIKTVYKW